MQRPPSRAHTSRRTAVGMWREGALRGSGGVNALGGRGEEHVPTFCLRSARAAPIPHAQGSSPRPRRESNGATKREALEARHSRSRRQQSVCSSAPRRAVHNALFPTRALARESREISVAAISRQRMSRHWSRHLSRYLSRRLRGSGCVACTAQAILALLGVSLRRLAPSRSAVSEFYEPKPSHPAAVFDPQSAA